MRQAVSIEVLVAIVVVILCRRAPVVRGFDVCFANLDSEGLLVLRGPATGTIHSGSTVLDLN